jgi:hypothetical protein
MAKKTKKLAEIYMRQLCIYDTVVPLSELFRHLNTRKSIRSFVKNRPAIEKDIVIQLLNTAELLLVNSLTKLSEKPIVE